MHADARRWVRAVHRSCAARLVSRRGLPKSSGRQSGGPVALRSLAHRIRPKGQAARGHACVVQRFDGVQLSRTCVLDRQVHEVAADHHVPVVHPGWHIVAQPIGPRPSPGQALARTADANAFSYTFSRNPAPGVSSTLNAQPITDPRTDHSARRHRRASACIALLHLRQNSCFAVPQPDGYGRVDAPAMRHIVTGPEMPR